MWKSTPLKWPETAGAIQSDAETITRLVRSQADAACERTARLIDDAHFQRHPLSEEAEALLALRRELETLVVEGTVLSVSPYQFQVGERLGGGYYLSPVKAVQTVCDKLRDLSDGHKPTGQWHAVALMLTASSLSEFASSLTTVCDVLRLPDWCQCARQARARVTLERDKLHQPGAIVQPRFKPCSALSAAPMREYATRQGAQIATLESLANDAVHVVNKLNALAEKRAARLDALSEEMASMKALKGRVFSLALSGTPESMATTLKQAVVPNQHPLTIVSLIMSDKPLTFWEELLCSL